MKPSDLLWLVAVLALYLALRAMGCRSYGYAWEDE